MEKRNRSETGKRIETAAIREFYRVGYEKASLRTICRSAGVTTGALYFSYRNKEELLQACLEPPVQEFEKMVADFTAMETQNPEIGTNLDLKVMKFLLAHRTESLIIMEKAGGSCYEHFHEKIEEWMFESFRIFFREKLDREPDPDLLRILVKQRIEGVLAILRGNYDRKHSLYLAEKISIHANSGAAALIEDLLKEAYRQ